MHRVINEKRTHAAKRRREKDFLACRRLSRGYRTARARAHSQAVAGCRRNRIRRRVRREEEGEEEEEEDEEEYEEEREANDIFVVAQS